MKIYIKPGKYVLGVSGGVDSMVLLDLLAKQTPSLKLIVAHFNHGIRPDGAKDEKLVRAAAQMHDWPVEIGYGRLGAQASEATARATRYEFLEYVRQKHRAKSIITAHHQDDLIETAILNTLRGSGRRGVSAISQNPKVMRPLLDYPKENIVAYAQKNNIVWREDSTNQDDSYLRNYVRSNVAPKLTKAKRAQLLKNTDNVAKTGIEIDEMIATLSHLVNHQGKINRYNFSLLPTEIGQELVMAWLRDLGIKDFDKKNIEKASITLKTAKAGSIHPITEGAQLVVGWRFAHLKLI